MSGCSQERILNVPSALLNNEIVECDPITYRESLFCIANLQYSNNILNDNINKIKLLNKGE